MRLHQVSYALKAHKERGNAVSALRLIGVGGFAPTILSKRFGQVLHRGCVAWLGRELPSWEELGEEWRELWCMHVSRLLIATYWGSHREKWELAAELTDDLAKDGLCDHRRGYPKAKS